MLESSEDPSLTNQQAIHSEKTFFAGAQLAIPCLQVTEGAQLAENPCLWSARIVCLLVMQGAQLADNACLLQLKIIATRNNPFSREISGAKRHRNLSFSFDLVEK